MAFDGIEITNRGRNLLAKAEAGLTKITYTKFSVGDGKLSGQLPTALKALINEKVSFPVSRLKIQSENVVVPGFDFGNQGIPNGFFFREVGLWATDPDLGEILYAYANSGEGAEYIDAQNTSAVLKKLFNFELTVSNTAQVTVVVDDTIIYATPQDVAEALKNAKDYTDTQIANVKVPDATTTVKGIVRLSESYSASSSTTVPNSKALYNLYNISLIDKGKPFTNDFNMMVAQGVWKIDVSSFTPSTDHSPPGAYSKGVLFVSGVNVTEGMTLVQRYVDETGGIFNRVRTAAATWTTWTEIGKSWRTERAIEIGTSFATAGPAFFDFHTSGKFNDYDSRIIATGGDTAAGRGSLEYLAAAHTFSGYVKLPGGTEVNGNAGVLNVVGNDHVYIPFFPKGAAAGRKGYLGFANPSDNDFVIHNEMGGNIRFVDQSGSVTVAELKQSVVDGKSAVAGAINGKGGNANGSNTFAELAAAITNLPGKRWARGTFNGQNAQASSWGQSIAMNVAINNLSFVVSRVFVWVKLTESDGFSQVEGFVTSSREGTNQVVRGWRSNSVGIDTLPPTLTNGFNLTITGSKIDAYAGGAPVSKVWAYEWWAFE
ncbi:hypothetical protein D3C74_93950 [compost metagenome]